MDYLEGGETLDEFLDDFPTLTRDAAVASLMEWRPISEDARR